MSSSWQEILIELVRARPCLYDKADANYFDTRGVKSNEWKDICEKLISTGFTHLDGVPTESGAVQVKWNNIRDSYRKNLDKREKVTRSGAGAGKEPRKYKYYDQLEWLSAVNKKRVTTTNRPTNAECTETPASSAFEHGNSAMTDSLDCAEQESVLSNITSPQSSVQSVSQRSVSGQSPAGSLPPPPSTSSVRVSNKRRRMTALPEDAEIASVQHQLAATSELIKTLVDRRSSVTADQAFCNMLALELATIPDGYHKDMLKLDIQKQIVDLKFSSQQSSDTASVFTNLNNFSQ